MSDCNKNYIQNSLIRISVTAYPAQISSRLIHIQIYDKTENHYAINYRVFFSGHILDT